MTSEPGTEVDLHAALGRVPLFAELGPEDLVRLSADLRRRRYPRGTPIIWRGDPGTTLYLIESGWVKIVMTSSEGHEVVFALLGPGEFFGDLALLDGRPRSATAVAAEESQLMLLEREPFLKAIEEHPKLAIRLLIALAERLRYATEQHHDAAALDVPARLARALLRLAVLQEGPEASVRIIPSRLTQAELAALIGATRESVNKWLRFYERAGIVQRRGARLLVLKPEELRKRID